jgi:hypothetical protein
MNANELIKQDHRDIEEMYKEYVVAEGDERVGLERMIATELTIHAEIEEEIYYPEYKKHQNKDLLKEYESEHNSIRLMTSKIVALSIAGKDTGRDMERLMAEVDHHVKEEEEEGLPLMEKLVGMERLEEMGTQMIERKEEIRESTMSKLWAALPAM